MFDFLNEAKRQVLLKHHTLGVLFPYSQALRQFLDNLKEFESDLKSKTSQEGPKRPEEIFAQEDIERVRNYVNLLLSDAYKEMLLLAHRTLKESGFDVWVHAGRRADINDWVSHPDYYTRCMHNYQEAVYRFLLERPERAKNEYILPLDLLLPVISPKDFQIKVTAHKGTYGHIRLERHPDLSNLAWIFRDEDPYSGLYSTTHQRINNQMIMPFYFRCAIFCLDQKYEVQEEQMGHRPKIIEESHPYLGFLGVKKKTTINEPIIRRKRIFKGGKILPLNQIVGTNEAGPAYLLQLCIPKIVLDGANRVAFYPLINLVVSKNLAEEIASFLLKYPDLFVELIRGFIPANMFPNVNKGILNAPSLASRGIIFDNFTNYSRITVD